MIVKDLVQGVYHKLAQRKDALERAPLWIRDAILELTESYDFEELRITCPTKQFIVGQAEYEPSYFTNNIKVTNIISWFVEITSSTGGGINLKYRTPPVVELISKISGPPSKWTRFGNKLIVGAKPDKAYNTYQRVQVAHPFLGEPMNIADIEANELRMPDSWREIVEFAAAERGAIELRMLDYAVSYHNIIYGDPLFVTSGGTRGTPGLIFKRTSQMERDMSHNERQLQPYAARYN